MRARDVKARAAEAAEAERLAALIPEERAQYLVEAAESWAAAGRPDRAGELFLTAIADGGHVVGDARTYYAGFLFDTGRPDEALHALAELTAARPEDPFAYVCAGEVLEEAADLDGALRWFTTGLTRFYRVFDLADAVDDATLVQLLSSRQRVRRLLELPSDGWDDLAVEAQAVLLADLTDP
jgi:tetratricopeptide (TPR) repeat protein